MRSTGRTAEGSGEHEGSERGGQGNGGGRGDARRVRADRAVDEERREIELCATSEAVDTYGTIFSYEASRDAFDRWAGNVREMHERKAVGRRVAVRCDDQARKVYVHVRISTGAEDTGGAARWARQPWPLRGLLASLAQMRNAARCG